MTLLRIIMISTKDYILFHATQGEANDLMT
jgi:hypothetical protein